MGRLTCPRVHSYMPPSVHETAPCGGDGRSAPNPRFYDRIGPVGRFDENMRVLKDQVGQSDQEKEKK